MSLKPVARVFDNRPCQLGEGPLWHPEIEQLFWFDILGNALLSRKADKLLRWQFDESVSAAAWLDENCLLLAGESGLYQFDLSNEKRELIVALDSDNPLTRSNDGRADPWGGFWIGTMGKKSEPGLGAIYRYYRGEVRRLIDQISISNSICFPPDAGCVYFCDSEAHKICSQSLADKDGWPSGEIRTFVNLEPGRQSPDGSVVDADGNLWNAQWGAARVACYSPAGQLLHAIELPTPQVSCPAFGGHDLTTLFVTSASDGLQSEQAYAGQTFAIDTSVKGQREHRVIL